MRSLRQNREQLESRVHEANDNLRDRVQRVNERVNEEVEQVRKGLHRRPLGGGGQWDYEQNRNAHQKVAAWSKGWLTLANGASVTGAGMTAYGLWQGFVKHNWPAATALMGTGRGLDLGDGAIAQVTETCSDKGAAIDAGFDKLLTVGFLALATKSGDMPVVETAVHGFQQARIFRDSYLIKNTGGEPNPSPEGKMGMAALWLRAGGIVLSHTLHDLGHETSAAVINRASQVASVTAIYYNQQASEGYNADRLALQANIGSPSQ